MIFLSDFTDSVADVMSVVLGILFIVLFIIGAIFCIIYLLKLTKAQRDFINELDEHDKALILRYEKIRVFKKNNKKVV